MQTIHNGQGAPHADICPCRYFLLQDVKPRKILQAAQAVGRTLTSRGRDPASRPRKIIKHKKEKARSLSQPCVSIMGLRHAHKYFTIGQSVASGKTEVET